LDATQSSLGAGHAFSCQVAAFGFVQADSETLAQWRRQPPPVAGVPIPASFLKHSEDQTVACVAALHDALSGAGWIGRSFADWGVVAAPSFLGRGGTAHSIQRFSQEGAWGVSPHLIPHQSLHAVSGTVSQLLKLHGPNFGISGGPNAAADAFLIAAPMLADGSLPGLWLLISGHEQEFIPTETGKNGEAVRMPRCTAIALALQGITHEDRAILRIAPDVCNDDAQPFTLGALADALRPSQELRSAAWRMPGAGSIELEAAALGAGSRR
jgi:hypothetical protein